MARTTVDLEQRVEAPISQVYRAFTNETALREWLADAAMARPAQGGRLHLWWTSGYYATGEYRKLAPDRQVDFTWQGKGEPRETRVSVGLRPDGEGTVVSLAHKGVGTGPKWGDTAESIRRGWERGLENLQSVLETGRDLRLIRRPMLGIYPNALTPEARARLGVPVEKGMLIGNVVEGMGAHAAGLQADDLITCIDQAQVGDWASLQAALSGHRAGDEVAVTYYRGPEKMTSMMTLSTRVIEDPPATPAALAEAIGAADEECRQRLEAALGGATEEAAGRRPQPTEWSAREVLCHLIVTHRSTQEWIADLVGGQERWSDDWAGNLDIAHAGLLSVYPTTADLLAELGRAAAETRAMVAALPEEFVARKGSYWRLARSLMELPEHNREHAAQVEGALAAG